MTTAQDLPAHVSYARVVTPTTTYHAFTLQHVGTSIIVHVNGNQVTLNDVTVTETVQGWRCAGVNAKTGEPEVWVVRKLSCGCSRSVGPTLAGDVPE